MPTLQARFVRSSGLSKPAAYRCRGLGAVTHVRSVETQLRLHGRGVKQLFLKPSWFAPDKYQDQTNLVVLAPTPTLCKPTHVAFGVKR